MVEKAPRDLSTNSGSRGSLATDYSAPASWNVNLAAKDNGVEVELLLQNMEGTFDSMIVEVQEKPFDSHRNLLEWPVSDLNNQDGPLRHASGCEVQTDGRDSVMKCSGGDEGQGQVLPQGALNVFLKGPAFEFELHFYMLLDRIDNADPSWAAIEFFWEKATTQTALSNNNFPAETLRLVLDGNNGYLAQEFTDGIKDEYAPHFYNGAIGPSPVQARKWHSYLVRRKAGKLWVLIDNQLVWEHATPRQWSSGEAVSAAENWQYKSSGMDYKTTAVQSVQIRPFQEGLIWGVHLVQEMGLIKVLWIESGRFAFNMDQAGYSVADGVVERDVVHCKFNEDGSLQFTEGKPWRLILIPEPCDASRSGTACAEVKQPKCRYTVDLQSECPEMTQCLASMPNQGACELTETNPWTDPPMDIPALNDEELDQCLDQVIQNHENDCYSYMHPSALEPGYELVMVEPGTPSHATYGKCPCKKENLRKDYRFWSDCS